MHLRNMPRTTTTASDTGGSSPYRSPGAESDGGVVGVSSVRSPGELDGTGRHESDRDRQAWVGSSESGVDVDTGPQ
jgi:hypothetical protein